MTDGDGRVTLAEARDKAAQHRHQRFHGTDPKTAKVAAKVAAELEAAKGVTFKECAEKLIASQKSGWKNEKHSDQWPATLEAYVYPFFGSTPVQDVDVALVMRVLEQDVPAAKGKPGGRFWDVRPETASRVRGRIEAVLDWATAREYRKGDNPARWVGRLKTLLPNKSKLSRTVHHAALGYRDIGQFMIDVAAEDGTAAKALQFLILTTTRTGETIGAKWPEIDFAARIWTIPPERMKAGKEHRVPLSDEALDLIEEMRPLKSDDSGYVFRGRKAGKPLSNMALLMLLERMQRDDITTHGFRATFKTWAEEQTSFPREVIELCLAHTIATKVEQAYRRGDILEKRRSLMADWAKFCLKSAGGGDNVVIGLKEAAE
jgi:integrase